jgi:hypothetical protein
MNQPPVLEMIRFAEEWWGQRLDDSLVERMARAPFKHLETFRDEWPFHRTFRDGSETAHPELEMFELPAMTPGEVRPARGWVDGWTLSVLPLLMYTESVVLSSGHAAPFSLPGLTWAERGKKQNRRITEHGFRTLVQLRPLLERGLVYFTNVDASPPYESYYRGGERYIHLGDALRHQYPEISDDDLYVITHAAPTHSRILQLASQRLLSLVAVNDFEERLYMRASSFAWGMLAGAGSGRDRRPTKTRDVAASTLARTIVPNLIGTSETIAELRDKEEIFTKWRASLHESLGMIGTLSDDPIDVREARVILAQEIDHSTRELRSAIEKSSALSRLVGGLRGFGVGACSALATTFGDGLEDRILNAGLGGVVGGAIGAAATGGSGLREALLVDELVVDFRMLAS